MNTSIGWVKDHECPAYTATQTLVWTAGPENAYITESATGVIVIEATTRAAEAAVVCTITNSVSIPDNPGIVKSFTGLTHSFTVTIADPCDNAVWNTITFTAGGVTATSFTVIETQVLEISLSKPTLDI